jgi:Asp-tRNA(Asn)/Glu-tRNA(Gln) amidotransferase C subunit
MNNKIAEYSQLEPLKKLTKLVQLDLSECPIAGKPDYRKKIFEMFSALEILDNKDVDGNSYDYEEGENEGDFEGDYEEGDLEGEEEFVDDGDEEDYQEEDEDDDSDDKGKPAKKLKK